MTYYFQTGHDYANKATPTGLLQTFSLRPPQGLSWVLASIFSCFFFSHELCDLCVCSPFSEDTPVLVMVTKATITSYNNVLRSQFVCTMCINPLLSSPAALVYHFLGLGTFKCQAEIQSFSMLSSNIYSNITQCVQCLSSFLMVFLFASIFSFLDVIIILQQH